MLFQLLELFNLEGGAGGDENGSSNLPCYFPLEGNREVLGLLLRAALVALGHLGPELVRAEKRDELRAGHGALSEQNTPPATLAPRARAAGAGPPAHLY